MDIICGFLKKLAWHGDQKHQVEAAKEITKRFKECERCEKKDGVIDIKKPVSNHDLKHIEYELKKIKNNNSILFLSKIYHQSFSFFGQFLYHLFLFFVKILLVLKQLD